MRRQDGYPALVPCTCCFSHIVPVMNKMGRQSPQRELFLCTSGSASLLPTKQKEIIFLCSFPRSQGTCCIITFHPDKHVEVEGVPWPVQRHIVRVGLGDGSAVENTGCFSRRPRFCSQCPLGNAGLSVIPVPESSSGLWACCVCVCVRRAYVHRQTHT